jgi:hypothetical protein
MKARITRLLAAIIVLTLTLFSQSLMACDFTFKIEGDVKTEYSSGDVVIVLVSLHLTHRVCPESIDETKFDFSGLKVLGATKWTETTNGVYERKFKLEVATGEKTKTSILATRTCDKDGGSGTFKLKVR